MVQIATRSAPSSSVGRGNPSPRPTPAALCAANHGGRASSLAVNRRWQNPRGPVAVKMQLRRAPNRADGAQAPRGGRFPHGVMVRIATRFAPSSSVGRGNPSPRPTPAALCAANHGGRASSLAVNRRWQNPRGPVAVKMQLRRAPNRADGAQARERRPPVGTRGSAKPALVTPSSADVSGAPPFHAGGVNGPTRSCGLLPVGARPAIHPAQTIGAHASSTTGC